MLTFCCALRPYLLPALLCVFLSLAAPGRAATLNVPSQYPTIQAAITATHDGDTVLVADGTYSGPGNRDIDFGGKNITVTSQHGAANTIIDCGGFPSADGSGNHRGFYLHSGETNAVISGLTIKNGYEIYVSPNQASSGGGGIFIYGSSVAVRNCVVTGNASQAVGEVGGYGGGIGIDNFNGSSAGRVTVTGCTVTGNQGAYGGGIDNTNLNNNGVITISGCTVANNSAQFEAGGIKNGNGSTMNSVTNAGLITLTNCTVTGNTAPLGGGVFNGNSVSGATISLTNCAITGNTSTANGTNTGGGGLFNSNGFYGCTITLTNCTVTGNTAFHAGGAFNYNYSVGNTIKLTNDVFYGDRGGEIVRDSRNLSNALVTYSDVQGGFPGTGNIDAAPLFVGAPTDLHLLPGSPCLGAGTSAGAPSTDADGSARPSPPSIGAYELKAAPPHQSHTHLLWNNTDGRVILWSIAADSSFTYRLFGPYTDGSASTPWSAAALATGPDGKSHILWTNPDGRVILWTVDDTGTFSYAVYGPYQDGAPNTPWSAKALSVGADNVVHLLWTNPDHRVILWNVDSAFNFTNAVFGPYDDGAPNTFWNATALATGPDNVTRLVWNNPDGRVILWNVDSAFGFTYHLYGPYNDGAPNTPWSAAAVSVGPDNTAHLLWTNPDTRVILWNLDASFNFTLAAFGPYTDGSASTPWNATALATGPDGLSHLLWTNPDNRVFVWGVDSAFAFTNVVYGPYTDGAPQNIWNATAISAGP